MGRTLATDAGQETEGVIKYLLQHVSAPPPSWDLVRPLAHWRRILRERGWIGQDQERYGGLGFGNLSRRCSPSSDSFVISGSQTGELTDPDASAYCQVLSADLDANQVISAGPVPPSSESLTHAAVYASALEISFVFHVHAPLLWRSWKSLGFAPVEADIAYGTQEMAASVSRLVRASSSTIMVMLGHEDGLLGVGASAEAAGEALLAAEEQRLRLDAGGA